MSLDSPYLVYGVISTDGFPYSGAVVYIQDTTASSAILEATTDSNGQYAIDIMDIADDGDVILIWCNLAALPTESFILDITGAMYEADLDFSVLHAFSLTQTPVSKNLYLYPNGAWASCCTAVGAPLNYQCVDDTYDTPDDDSTYVWHNRTTMCTDMYILPNHTTESGTINYVRVYARAKSSLYPQSSTGSYRILAYHSGVTARSSDIDITTDYNTYSYVMTSTPSGAAWNWNAIDALRIGFDCNSPTISGQVVTSIIRPSGAGLETECNPVGESTNWECVLNNNTSSYVESILASRYYDDLYALDDHTTETGVISKINVFYKARRTSSAWIGYAKSRVSISGTSVYGTENHLTAAWQYYQDEWALNPDTAAAWTWVNIDALQAGVSLNQGVTNLYHAECSDLYVVVTYLEDLNPHIRTTQMYALVNYTPSTETCYLNSPMNYMISNSRKVNIVHPERGDRIVYDICRENKTLTMTGVEYDTDISTATTRLQCVRDQKDNGMYVTISGIGDTKVDTTWLITDFTYSRDQQNQRVWNWMLTAEKYESG